MDRKEVNEQLQVKIEAMVPLTDQMSRKNKKSADSAEIYFFELYKGMGSNC